MRVFARPRILVSKCLGFDHCRHDGAIIRDAYLAKLGAFVDFVQVCPEVEIGLGTPRDPIRIVRNEGSDLLLQPSTGRDLTAAMETFATDFLAAAAEPDGVVLKGRSPSCAISDTKVYGPGEKPAPLERGPGFFGKAVLERHATIPITDEGRLKNFTLREHFFTTVFALADFRAVRTSGDMNRLVEFHTAHKLALLAVSQSEMRGLGQIVANHDRRPFPEVVAAYEEALRRAFARPASATAVINVLQHAMGYFSKDRIEKRETHHLLDVMDKYRQGSLPLSAPVSILRSLIIRFEEPYLSRQTFFEPYPEDLVEITDSGKGRNR